MEEVDYIIVGCGLAGIAFAEQLIQHNKSFVVFDNASQQSSAVAAGLYNPVVLKRFTEVWKANEQLSMALAFYKHLEDKLEVKLDFQLPVYRRFASIEEQNDWFAALDKPNFDAFLSKDLIKNSNPSVIAPLGFGRVLQTGRIDTKQLLIHYKMFLKNSGRYINSSFEYQDLEFKDHFIYYNEITSKQIVFAEGFGMMQNPYFRHLPLNVAKGEIITIKAPDLKIDYILKSSVFIIPEGNELYSVGATYNWKDQSNSITSEAKDELMGQLHKVISCEYEVVAQVAGIRPTVKDRKPLIGMHDTHKNVAILNGLGTRGVMIAPYVAKQLFDHIELGTQLEAEIDIKRFNS